MSNSTSTPTILAAAAPAHRAGGAPVAPSCRHREFVHSRGGAQRTAGLGRQEKWRCQLILPVACRAGLRARVSARLGAERGDTLIEVMVAALLVGLIATASLTGFTAIGHSAGTQRNEEQAATLAQQDQARLRGLTITQLSGSGGNTPAGVNTTIDGTTYNVVSKSLFIAGASGASSCTSGGTASADEVQTTSTVTWGTGFNNGGRAPVVLRHHHPVAGRFARHLGCRPDRGRPCRRDRNRHRPDNRLAAHNRQQRLRDLRRTGRRHLHGDLLGSRLPRQCRQPAGELERPGDRDADGDAPQLHLAQDGAISATFTTFYNGLRTPRPPTPSSRATRRCPHRATRSLARTTRLRRPSHPPRRCFPMLPRHPRQLQLLGLRRWLPGHAAAGRPDTDGHRQPTATTAVVLPLPAMIVNVWATATVTPFDDPVADVKLAYSADGSITGGGRRLPQHRKHQCHPQQHGDVELQRHGRQMDHDQGAGPGDRQRLPRRRRERPVRHLQGRSARAPADGVHRQRPYQRGSHPQDHGHGHEERGFHREDDRDRRVHRDQRHRAADD